MFLKIAISFFIVCAVINAQTYIWSIDKEISQTLYNPYVLMSGLVDPTIDVIWKRDVGVSDKIMLQAYYLQDKEYKFVNYSLCGTYAENSQEKLFQSLTYRLFTGNRTCPIRKGTFTSVKLLNFTTNIKSLSKCQENEVKINGFRDNLPKQYFGHFLYVLLVVNITGGDCR